MSASVKMLAGCRFSVSINRLLVLILTCLFIEDSQVMCTKAVFQNACYTIECNNTDFDDAVKNCKSINATLLSIHSLEEDNFVKHLVEASNYGHVYVGLQRIDVTLSTSYYWNDNSSVDYMSNATDLETHHNERCHIIDKSKGYDWEEARCSKEYCDPIGCNTQTTAKSTTNITTTTTKGCNTQTTGTAETTTTTTDCISTGTAETTTTTTTTTDRILNKTSPVNFSESVSKTMKIAESLEMKVVDLKQSMQQHFQNQNRSIMSIVNDFENQLKMMAVENDVTTNVDIEGLILAGFQNVNCKDDLVLNMQISDKDRPLSINPTFFDCCRNKSIKITYTIFSEVFFSGLHGIAVLGSKNVDVAVMTNVVSFSIIPESNSQVDAEITFSIPHEKGLVRQGMPGDKRFSNRDQMCV
ncbi:uncharacterized protein LOC117111505 isoform X2 [Anneissia japonica]|uniref:uncharacterized protein LOC117111505 isoform X2 n=1 Tax=Anneissia japonica TaxID=1529436 RepID=UPI00142567F3|nr:uncharacterized protein LOC117111505 isoform X2 [Anneissia japonica]